MELQDKMNLSREKYKRAALLLTDFLDDLLTSTPNILQSDKDMHLNLDKMYGISNPLIIIYLARILQLSSLIKMIRLL